jgi:quercetin dioxygenase-like cupin family protein
MDSELSTQLPFAKATLAALLALVLTALTQEPKPNAADAKPNGERDGAATVLHRDSVLSDRGGGRHLWPLLHTEEARMNYFEVTSRGALHFHPDADHRLYVLEGTVLVTCGSTTIKCTEGDFIIIPRGVRHCYDVAGPGEKALLLTFDAPPYDPKKTVNLEPKPVEK